MTDREIIDNLNEAARYMRTRPDVSRELIMLARSGIAELFAWSEFSRRLDDNLIVSHRYAQVEPEVSAGYCRGVAFEIQAYGKKQ